MIVSNLSKTIGSKTVLDNISFVLNENDKVGLVGINGSGKSTLLKTLSGLYDKDGGSIKLNNESIGILKQEIDVNDNQLSIIDYIKKETNFLELESKLHFLENNLSDENMEEYGNVLNSFLQIDGYSFEENLQNILNGLNFKEDLSKKVGTLSGGEKIKVLLAVLLMQNPDIMLLDEPTNNLDLNTIVWLENYLKNMSKKMIIVSHDEEFLNSITNKIFELNNSKLTEYNLKYKDYLVEKENEYQRNLQEYTKAKEQQESLKRQLNKAKEWSNIGLNSKAHNDNDKLANNYSKERTKTSNVSKISSKLESLEIPDFQEKESINFFFNFDESKGNSDIVLEDLVCGYDDFKTVSITISIPFRTRLNITGSNGSGKTTLIRTILNEIPQLSGKLSVGSNVKFGYISQNTLTEKNENSIYTYLTKDLDCFDKSLIFTLLDKFNIPYEDRDKNYSLLSPGERTRVNLAKLALDKINVLVIDEITNHLDKEALDLIYELVNNFNGTIISISHNRKFNEVLDPNMLLNMENGLVENEVNKRVKSR